MNRDLPISLPEPPPPCWNGVTGFLKWNRLAAANGKSTFRSVVAMCELEVEVLPDPSGKTWAIEIDGVVVEDDIATVGEAQILALGHVIQQIAEMCGTPGQPSRTVHQQRARALLEEIHSRLKGEVEDMALERLARLTPPAEEARTS